MHVLLTGGSGYAGSHTPRRDGDPPILVADCAKAVREFGWTPQLSSLDYIAETACKWYVAHAAARHAHTYAGA
jgi:UDP-glucose 4-epimerase